MVPSILLGGKNKFVIGDKVKRSVRRQAGERIIGLISAVPDLFAVSGCRIRHPNCPRRYSDRDEWKLVLTAGSADESYAMSVGGPTGRKIAIGAGGKIANAITAEVINSDEAVTAATTYEGYLAAVGG